MLNLLINEKDFDFDLDYLPCLINYKEKEGGSKFSIDLISDLFEKGEKVLFFCAYPMGQDGFLGQISNFDWASVFVDFSSSLVEAEQFQAVVIKSGDEALFMEALENLPDVDERIIFVKNFETYNDELVEKVLSFEKIILSGDIENSSMYHAIERANFKTKITFSKTELPLFEEIPELKKYEFYMKGENISGVVVGEF